MGRGGADLSTESDRANKPVHGTKGAYVAGDWVNIEDCAEHFMLQGKKTSCNHDCHACPRSRSKQVAAKEDGSYDIVIIGAGCIGAAIARELSKYSCSVLLLEAADDVTQGATKGNSGIVHAGYDDKPGSVRAKFCWKGNQMFAQLDSELHFGYQRNGSMVLARGPEEERHLEELKARGEQNGVERLRIIGKDEVLRLEPYVHPDVTAALVAPDAGNLIPYEYAIALAENAADNGVEVRIRRLVTDISCDENGAFTVTAKHWEPKAYMDHVIHKNTTKGFSPVAYVSVLVAMAAVKVMQFQYSHSVQIQPLEIIGMLVIMLVIAYYQRASLHAPVSVPASPVGMGGSVLGIEEMKVGGSGSISAMQGETVEIETVKTRYVINCAGCAADTIAHMIGDDSFKIKPRVGNYILLNKNQGHLAQHTLFPCPGPLGKGVLVQTTLWGNLILGPTARDMHLPEVANESNDSIMKYIITKCKELVPSFDVKEVIHTFSGARAKSTRGDWIIEPSAKNPKFIHVAGIDSPGLAGSPAIALEVVSLLKQAGMHFTANPNFNPYRAPIVAPKDGWKGIRAGPMGKVTNPKENVICKCEKVTEAEVVEALRRNLPVDSTQSIRRRTRAGMGHCQADPENYNCEHRVAAIIARETGLPIEAVGRRPWPATSTLNTRWPSDEERKNIEALGH